MPGITGIISYRPTGGERGQLEAMLGCMRHEAFYASGRYDDEAAGIHVGFVSMPGSFTDGMPFFSEDRSITLFLTGECYVDDGTITGLRAKGHDVGGDRAGFLVALYRELGDRFFRELNGWYNGLLLDSKAGKAFLFNDRYGIRRIYYRQTDAGFYFSSEAKSLLAIFPDSRALRPDSVAEFLVYDAILEDKTYFPGVFTLPTASAWAFARGQAAPDRFSYLDPTRLEGQTPLGQAEFDEEFIGLFKRVLPRYFRGGKIGMSLTGGLDTRLIMAMRNSGPGELPCYTFGGRYRDIFDVRLAPKIAAICGQEHRILRLDDEAFLKDYPAQLTRSIYVTDGVESVDKTDVMSFNRMAREISPLRMSGKYGSQVLKHILGFQERPPMSGLVEKGFASHMDTARATCAGLKRTHPFSFLLYREIPWWWNGFIASESSQVSIRSPYLDNDLVGLLYRAPSLATLDGVGLQLEAIRRFRPELLKVPTTGSYGGVAIAPVAALKKRAIKLLLDIDKVQIRERVPHGLTHHVARVDKVLHRLSIDRAVSGFADFRRYRVWYRDQLAPFIRDTLLDKRTLDRPYWDPAVLRRAVDDHIRGRGTYLREIRKVLQVEMIHRVLCEGKF